MNLVCLISAVAAVNLILVFARLMYFESKLSIAELKPEVLRCVLLRVRPALYVVKTLHTVLLTLGKMEKMVQLSDLYPSKIDILWRSEQLKSKDLAGPFLRNCILKFFIR